MLFWTNTSEDLTAQLLLVDIPTLEKRVFTSVNGTIFIGGVEVSGQVREVLRDEAKYVERSSFWEVFNAAIIDEAAKIALTSTNFEQVERAQMLKAWAFRFQEAVKLLTV